MNELIVAGSKTTIVSKRKGKKVVVDKSHLKVWLRAKDFHYKGMETCERRTSNQQRNEKLEEAKKKEW